MEFPSNIDDELVLLVATLQDPTLVDPYNVSRTLGLYSEGATISVSLAIDLMASVEDEPIDPALIEEINRQRVELRRQARRPPPQDALDEIYEGVVADRMQQFIVIGSSLLPALADAFWKNAVEGARLLRDGERQLLDDSGEDVEDFVEFLPIAMGRVSTNLYRQRVVLDHIESRQ